MSTHLAVARSMDLKSGAPFWAVKNGLLQQYPSLRERHETDVLIVGGGITGALICDALVKKGHRVSLVEQREIGWGSTAASTALLQYEIDTPLTELADKYGKGPAEQAYLACKDAISTVGRLAKSVRDVDYRPMQSLFYASDDSHVAHLEREWEARREAGFEIEMLSSDDLDRGYGLQAPRALLNSPAACLDPYRLTYRLLKRQVRRGASVFERTEIESLEIKKDKVLLRTATGSKIVARHVVVAAGYATQKWMSTEVAKNRSSYAFITDPLPPELLGKLMHTVVWESAQPYIYLRTTGDGRLLVGGEDDAVDVPAKRDLSVGRKVDRLLQKVKRVLPRLEVEPAFGWGGTFAETEDGLPYFGPHDDYGPRVHFAMAYGGNGITYSAIGAEIIACALENRAHDLAQFFSFARASVAKKPGVLETVGGKVRDAVSGKVRDAVSGKVRDAVSGKVRDAVPDFLRAALPLE